jgi:hypothetical protein
MLGMPVTRRRESKCRSNRKLPTLNEPGRTPTVCEAQALAIAAGGEEWLVAAMTGTFTALLGRQGVTH